MSREDIIAVASRLFAVYLFLSALRMAAAAFSVQGPSESLEFLLLWHGAMVLPTLAIAALLWFFPLTVARRLLPVMKQAPPPVTVPGSLALALALTVLGLWLLATALPDTVYWLTWYVQMRDISAPMEVMPDQTAGMAATAAEVLLGLWLVLGSRGLSAVVTRLRFAGSEKANA